MTTVTKTKLKKYAKASGIAAVPLGLLLIIYLVTLNLITITGNSGDMACAGTITNPCLALINFTANDDVSIGKLDDKGLFYTDKALKDVKVVNLKTKKELNFSKTNSLKKGQNYSWMIIAYKINPSDTIKWGFGPLDPTWYPEIDYNITQSPANNTSYNLLNNTFQCNITLYNLNLGDLNNSNVYVYEDGILIQNASKVVTGTTNSSIFNLDIFSGNHTYFCSFDTIGSFNGNFNFTANPLNSSRVVINNSNYTIYNSSLILMYNFDNVSSLGENNTRIVDVSLYGNNGTATGIIFNSTGKYGGSYIFNGVNSSINIGNKIHPDKTFTISAWIKTASIGEGSILGDSNLLAPYQGITLRLKANLAPCTTAGTISLWTGDNTNFYICSTKIINDNLWHHIVASYNGSNAFIFIDDILNASAIRTNGLSGYSGVAYIGSSDATYYFNGTIDEFRIFNRTLNATEINILYNSNLAKFNQSGWNYIANQTNLSIDKFCYTSQDTETCAGNTIDMINGSIYNLFNPENVFIRYTNLSARFIFRNNKINESLPDGQTNETGFYNVTNYNVKNISVYSSVNYTVPQVYLKAGNNSNYSTSIVLNTTNKTIISNLTGGSYNYIWFWADYVNYSGAGFRYAPKLSINYL